VELSLKHVHDDRFEVDTFDVGFAIGAPVTPEVVKDNVDRQISLIGTIEGVQLDLRITNSTPQKNWN
jgi:hypothetical protein